MIPGRQTTARAKASPAGTAAIAATDGELLMRFSRNEEGAALKELLDRHAPMVWGVCRGVLHREQDAEDAFQATFMILLRRAKSIRATESAAGWLYRVALRTALAARRAGRRRREESLVEEPPAPEVAFPPLHLRHMRRVMMEELRALPDQYQTALVMRYLEGQSRREIADQTDSTVAAVQGRLARGKRMLRMRLARRGVSLSLAMGLVAGGESADAAAATSTLLPSPALLSPGGSLASPTPVVQLLVSQGIRSMFIATYAKPFAAATLVALAAMLAVAADQPITPTPSVAALQLQSEPLPGAEEQEVPAPRVEMAQKKPETAATAKTIPQAAKAPEESDTPSPPQEELIQFYKKLVARMQQRYDSGTVGASQLASAKYSLASAQARLAESQGERQQAIAFSQTAVKAAKESFQAYEREYNAGLVTLDTLTQAAEQRAASKQSLVALETNASSKPLTPQPTEGPIADQDTQLQKQQLDLECDYWQMKAQALNDRAKAMDAEARRKEKLREQVPNSDLATELQKFASESLMMRAEAKLAESKAIELKRRIAKLDPPQSTMQPTPTRNILPPSNASGGYQPFSYNQPTPTPGPHTVYEERSPGQMIARTVPGFANNNTYQAQSAEPDTLKPLETINIRVGGVLPDQPIDDAYAISPEGTIDLGPTYGRVSVAGMTLAEAETAIQESLSRVLQEPRVQVTRPPAPEPDWQDPRQQTRYQQPPVLFPQPAPPTASHTIKPGDNLLLEIVAFPSGEPLLDGREGFEQRALLPSEVVVEAEGTLALGALWGRVEVAGKSLSEVEKIVHDKVYEVFSRASADNSSEKSPEFRVQVTRHSEHSQRGGGQF